MGFPIFLPLFIILISVIGYFTRKNKRTQEKVNVDFLERERLANSTRKQDISNLPYLNFSTETLPVGKCDDERLSECEAVLKDLENKKILNLSKHSNTDLKLLYGPANLELLSSYDENYHTLSTTLLRYAVRETELNRDFDAAAILEYAVTLRIDSSQIYLLLNTLYERNGTPEKCAAIKDALNQTDEPFRSYVLRKLESARTDEADGR